MKQKTNYSSSVIAFVLKNFIPEKHKVVLLHQKLGKITCVYKKYDRVARLCTGAQIECIVEKKQNWYEIVQFDILFTPERVSLSELSFIHNVSMLCLRLLPANIVVGELFDFLMYVYQYFDQLTSVAQQIILLRLFLLFDVFPENKTMYRCALQDPYADIQQSEQDVMDYVAVCWRQFYHELGQ